MFAFTGKYNKKTADSELACLLLIANCYYSNSRLTDNFLI